MIPDTERERALWEIIRQALLLIVDGIERFLGMRPRTSELRAEKRKEERAGG